MSSVWMSYRVLCGGSWGIDPQVARVVARNRITPDIRGGGLGLRLVRRRL